MAEKKKFTADDFKEERGAFSSSDFAEDVPANVDLLSGYEKTQEKIAGRRGQGKEISRAVTDDVGIVDRVAASVLTPGVPPELARATVPAIGEVAQRLESAVAGPLRVYQEEGLERPGRMIDAFTRGLSGRERSEFGDIFRNVGVPEPMAAVGGLGVVSGLLDVASRGKITGGIKRLNNLLKDKSRFNLVTQAKKITTAVDDVADGFSKAFGAIYKRIGDKPVDVSALDKIGFWNEIPSKSVSAIGRALGKEFKPTINNLKKIKGIIRKQVPRQIQSGRLPAGDDEARIFRGIEKLNNVIAASVDDAATKKELLNLNKGAVDFYKARRSVNGLMYDGNGNLKTSELPGLFERGSQGKLKILADFQNNYYPKLSNTLSTIEKLNSRAKVMDTMGRVVGNTVAFGTAGAFIGAPIASAVRNLDIGGGESK